MTLNFHYGGDHYFYGGHVYDFYNFINYRNTHIDHHGKHADAPTFYIHVTTGTGLRITDILRAKHTVVSYPHGQIKKLDKV